MFCIRKVAVASALVLALHVMLINAARENIGRERLASEPALRRRELISISLWFEKLSYLLLQ